MEKNNPMSPVQLLLRPSPWVVFFLFCRGFCHLGPRTPQNPWKNQKQKNKQTKITRCHLSSFSSDPLHGSIFFCFVEVFATVSIQQYQLLIFLCFLFSCFLGSWEKFSPWQTSIGTAFNPSHFILMFSLSYWFWLLNHQKKITVKTTLSPTSSGTLLDWCFIGMPRFWFLMFKGLVRVLQTWNH